MCVALKAGQPVSARVTCEGNEIFCVTETVPEIAVNRPITAEEIAARLAKTGGTVYELGKADIDPGSGLMLSASAVNALRRDILARLDEMFLQAH